MKQYHRNNRFAAALWALLIVLFSYLPGAWAQPTVTTTNLPAYESFATSYTEGENLGAVASASLLNWPAGNSASSSSARIFQAAALSYPSLLTEVTNTSRGLKGGTGTGKNRSFFFNPAVNTNANNVLYASFLFSLQTNNPAAPRLFTCLSSGSGTGPTVDAGIYIDAANHLLVGKNTAISATALPSTVSPATYSITPSNTYLVVLRYKFNAGSSTNDEVALWINPTALGNNASVPSPSIVTTNGNDTVSTLKTINYLVPSTGLNSTFPFYIDEIRIGTNWADVTPTNSIAGTLYTVSGGGSGCVGDSFPINLSGSDVGVTYLLYTNGVYSGFSTNGTGSAITLGPLSATCTYTLLATNSLTAGVSWMPGNAVVSVLSVPTLSAQSGSVVAATNSTIQFSVTSADQNIIYRWYRNGSPLSDDSHLGGSSSSILTISPVLATDAATTSTGYYCVITNTCGYRCVSATNALTIQVANNLVWQGTPTNLWDVAASTSWTNGAGSAVVFNQGDNVLLNDSYQNSALVLASPYLSPGTVTYNATTAMSMGGSGSLSGTNSSLIINGPSASSHLSITNANSYGGGTVINDGWVTVSKTSSLGTGVITLTGTGSSLLDGVPAGGANVGLPGLNTLADSTLTFIGSGSYACVVVGPLTGTSGKTLTLKKTTATSSDNFRLYHTNFTLDCNLVLDLNSAGRLAPYNSSGTQVYNGVISGTGALFTRNSGGSILLNGANTYSGGTLLSLGTVGVGVDSTSVSGPFGADANLVTMELSGNVTLFASGGSHAVGNPLTYRTTTNTAALIFTGSNQFVWSGTMDLSAVTVDGPATNRTIQVDSTGPVVLSGVIGDQGLGCGLIKTGSGVLYLDNAANTYSGLTTVSGGRLAGSGTLVTPVTVGTTNGGVLGGGSAAAIGTLTVNNNVTFSSDNGGAYFRVNKSLSPGQSNDVVSVSGSLNNLGSGTVTITNLGPALAIGDKFTLFNKAVTGGAAFTVTGGGMNWSNRLSLDGSIVALSAASTMATNPTNITFSVSGSVLTLSWPADHLGWYLQVQTNSLSTGLGTNWVFVPGSSSVVTTNFTVNPANASVFYRLKSSNP